MAITIGEDIKQKIAKIKDEKDPLMKKLQISEARTELYIYQRVCEAFEEETSE